ncbi:MAG TPA: SGNH/GDSL hydrolase family protein [Chthoniobacteraceae bacterium]|jgi:alpha-galactosidase|nr:SGNH/GDSL hydrolase family protein [Chthoniobacteraceae bacterium]
MNLRAFSLFVALLAFSAGPSRAEEGKGGRLLFVGNSITLHGPSEAVGWTGNWGMAASAAEKDYVHLVVEAVAKRRGSRPEFRVVNVAEFERDFEKYDPAAKLKDLIAFEPDTVIVAIGENVPALKTEEAKAKFKESTVRLLTLLKGEGTTLYLRSCFWADATKDSLLKEACNTARGVFVDISALDKDKANFARAEREIAHAGVARHPGDQGMKAIADALIVAMEKAPK